MASPVEADTPQRPGRYQFGLRGLFILATGVSVGLSLICSVPVVGGLLAVVVVGYFWMVTAKRAGAYSLAYYVAAFTAGAVWHAPLLPVFL
jgi:hypothetical protein